MNKPVLAITDTNTDLKDMIVDNDCGWWCDAMDEEMVFLSMYILGIWGFEKLCNQSIW